MAFGFVLLNRTHATEPEWLRRQVGSSRRSQYISKDLAELKSSLQFTQKDVEDLKPVTKQMTKIGKELNEV